MDPADALLLVVAVGGGAATLSVSIKNLLNRRHLRVVQCELACPRTAGAVRCELVIDGKSGLCVEARRCSRLGDGRPTCDQDCIRLLNLGIPLHPTDPDTRPEG